MGKNLLITMSGGTTCVINATLVGIIQESRKSGEINKIYAGRNGLPGVFANDLVDLSNISEEELNRIYYTPTSGYIGTSRIKFLDETEMQQLAQKFSENDISYFFNIGGNGTIKQSMAISQAVKDVKVVSIAKTVDNDLGDQEFEKVYFTPGYPSCANYWLHKTHIFNQENIGAHSHDQVIVSQTFGRETGHLAACARLADPQRKMPLLILLPEDQRSTDELISAVKQTIKLHKRAMIVMSEGYHISDIGERNDLSGQIMYGSSTTTQAQNLVNLLCGIGIQARAFIPGYDQRDEILLASEYDLKYACGVGSYAVQKVLEGEGSFLSSISSNTRGDITYIMVPFAEIGDFSRRLPGRWIRYGEFDVTDAFVDYAMPLVGKGLVGRRFYWE